MLSWLGCLGTAGGSVLVVVGPSWFSSEVSRIIFGSVIKLFMKLVFS